MSPVASTRETPESPCPNCGAAVQPPTSAEGQVACPSCGTLLKLDKKGKLVRA
jgi:endogenous inhibitor of DNA gyrase (YacG/DUF329 family)